MKKKDADTASGVDVIVKHFISIVLCRLFSLHDGKHPEQPPIYFDGCNLHGRCSVCGKSVTRGIPLIWF